MILDDISTSDIDHACNFTAFVTLKDRRAIVLLAKVQITNDRATHLLI